MKAQVMDPFDRLQLTAGALPEKWDRQRPRFAAAIGAALGGLLSA